MILALGAGTFSSAYALDCESYLGGLYNEAPRTPPKLSANSKWYSYTDTLNGYVFHIKIYKAYDSMDQDIYGEVVIAPPSDSLDLPEGKLTREFMIVDLKLLKDGYRLYLREAIEGDDRVKIPWLERTERKAELIVTLAANSLHTEQDVNQLKLKWDHHPVLPVYRFREWFYRGFLQQEHY